MAAYLLRPDQRVFDLGDLTVRHLKRELAAQAPDVVEDDQLALFDDEPNDAGADAMVRARAVVELAETLAGELSSHEDNPLLVQVELPLLRTLATMERRGIAVDEDYLAGLYSSFDDQVRAAEQAAYASLGKQINLGSPKQLRGRPLRRPRHAEDARRTRTGYTTDADALEWLYSKTEHPFLEHLRASRPDPAAADR